MHILLAPDKFKESLSAARVAQAMERGARRVSDSLEIDSCPMADGGEGTVDSLVRATGGRFETRRVMGPLPEMKVDAQFGILGDGKTAVIEMAAASGLALLRAEDRDPSRTTSFGTGQLLLAAAEIGVSTIILGIGGSATIDGGIGAAQACGLPVILADGEPISLTEPLVGADLERVVLIKHGRGSPIEKIRIVVAADVANPLFGPNGAAAVFGPQKGAGADQVKKFDADLRELARRTGKLELAVQPGAGAAGGMGFAMLAFFGASLRSGIEIVMEAVGFQTRLTAADLCLTGEGRLDASSFSGKTVGRIARMCRSLDIPCVAVVGSIATPIAGTDLTAAISIQEENPELTLQDCIAQPEPLIAAATQKAVRAFTLKRGQ